MGIFVLIVSFAALCFLLGIDCFLARCKALSHWLIWVVPALLALITVIDMGVTMEENGFGFALMLLGLFILLYLFFRYSMAFAYRIIKFYSKERENYSIRAYNMWRKGLHYEEDNMSGSSHLLGFFLAWLLFAILFFPRPKIPENFVVLSEPVESATLVMVSGTNLSALSNEAVTWTTTEETKLEDVWVYIVRDKNDKDALYWLVYVEDLSEENLKKLPSPNGDFVVVSERQGYVITKDGEVLFY